MKRTRLVAAIAIATLLLLIVISKVQGDDEGMRSQRNAYTITSLVSNLTGAVVEDPVLQNAWGVAFTPAASPFWISDNATGCSTLYGGDGTKVALQVSIPLPGNVVPAGACSASGSGAAAPTAMAWNPSSAFLVPGTNLPASFI